MKENKNVQIYFRDFGDCPTINMPSVAYDRLVNELLNDNARRFVDFDEVAIYIKQLSVAIGFDCVAFSDWWFNNTTARYGWPKSNMSINITEGAVFCWIKIGGLVKKYDKEKTMDRVKAGGVYHSYNGDFDMELAKRQMKDLINGPYGILTSIADKYCNLIHIKDVIFNDPATIVFWSDGTKTVCTCSEQDTYDPEKGLALCVMKRMLYNNKGHIFNNAREKWLKKGNKR